MDAVLVIGRILFGMLFVTSAIGGHFMATDAMVGYAEMRGMKPGRPLVLLSGLGLLAGGLGIILGIWIDLAALTLAVLMFVTAFGIHHFWTDSGEARQMDMVQFQKDVSLGGAALWIFAAYAGADASSFLLTDPLF